MKMTPAERRVLKQARRETGKLVFYADITEELFKRHFGIDGGSDPNDLEDLVRVIRELCEIHGDDPDYGEQQVRDGWMRWGGSDDRPPDRTFPRLAAMARHVEKAIALRRPEWIAPKLRRCSMKPWQRHPWPIR
jgi:hypothetical protein